VIPSNVTGWIEDERHCRSCYYTLPQIRLSAQAWKFHNPRISLFWVKACCDYARSKKLNEGSAKFRWYGFILLRLGFKDSFHGNIGEVKIISLDPFLERSIGFMQNEVKLFSISFPCWELKLDQQSEWFDFLLIFHKSTAILPRMAAPICGWFQCLRSLWFRIQ